MLSRDLSYPTPCFQTVKWPQEDQICRDKRSKSGLKRWGMWAHVWQHAAVKVGHDLGHACAGSLGRPVDHHPGGAKHQRYAVRHVEHPRHSDVRVAHQKPAQQLSGFSGYLRCLGECLYYCGLLTCLQICVAMGHSWKLDVLKDASQIA